MKNKKGFKMWNHMGMFHGFGMFIFWILIIAIIVGLFYNSTKENR